MTRHFLAFAAVTALGAATTPAIAQEGAPPPSAWVDLQGAPYPLPPPMGADPGAYGVAYPHPLPPGAYPRASEPFQPQGMPYPGGPGPYPPGPTVWRGEMAPAYGDDGSYWYAYQTGGAPCGCPAYAWVPVPIETRYRYSAPLRHVEDVVEENVVHEQVVERKVVPARSVAKYVKTPPVKLTKIKTTRSTK